MKSNHMLGTNNLEDLEFAFSQKNIDLMNNAKIRYIRMPLSFPFADESTSALSENYINELDVIRRLKTAGFDTLAATDIYSRPKTFTNV